VVSCSYLKKEGRLWCHANAVALHIMSRNGTVRGHPRYRCKACGLNFIEGDRRVKESVAVKKALAVILYSLGKASFGILGKLFGHAPSLIYRWIVAAAAQLPEPVVPGDIREMEFDGMWHFIGSKKPNSGSSRRWIVAHGELWPGWSAVVMLQPSNGSRTRSNISRSAFSTLTTGKPLRRVCRPNGMSSLRPIPSPLRRITATPAIILGE
jgi:transposase